MDYPPRNNNNNRLPPSSSSANANNRPGSGTGTGTHLTANSLKRHDMMTGGTSRSNNHYTSNNSEAGRVTNASTRSVAESIISRASARKGKF